jgi:hypothetical protein
VHQRIVVHPAISDAIREMLLTRSSRSLVDGERLPSEFLEAYWRKAAPSDLEWGGRVARAIADAGRAVDAERLSEELINLAPTPEFLAQLVRILAGGSQNAEQVAVHLAENHFSVGRTSADFVGAAAVAVSYQPRPELAALIIESPLFDAVAPLIAADVLEAAGRVQDAGIVLVTYLATLDPDDPSIERVAARWERATARDGSLRNNLNQRNSRVLTALDSIDGVREHRQWESNRRYFQ